MICYSCLQRFRPRPSWRSLLLKERAPVLCSRCAAQCEPYDAPYTLQNGVRVDIAYTYNDMMKTLLYNYKENRDVALATLFAQLIRPTLKRHLPAVIVPIPAHLENVKRRTFSHIDQLLIETGFPYVHLLEKTTPQHMSEKTREERLQFRHLFNPLKSDTLDNKRKYVVVDDVVTTGNTLMQATNLLYELGATKIAAVALCRPSANIEGGNQHGRSETMSKM